MAKIVAKRYIGIKPVYNMEVYGLHNYITALGTILHNCRYYCISRQLAAEAIAEKRAAYETEEDAEQDYESFMCGGEATEGYMAC